MRMMLCNGYTGMPKRNQRIVVAVEVAVEVVLWMMMILMMLMILPSMSQVDKTEMTWLSLSLLRKRIESKHIAEHHHGREDPA